ncbi:MAG TPA: hypothetical protein VMV49_05265 [Candidatus Deferrimicrobium sp.]|nr:hypothetical protein [Candidatus Deferrimicrobium sp.]
MIKYLIGGFIYAVTHGIKEIVKDEYEIQLKTMDFGRLKMLFYYGKSIFGVLFTQDINDLVYEKLQKFTNEFETDFQKELEKDDHGNWLNGTSDAKNVAYTQKVEELLKISFKF